VAARNEISRIATVSEAVSPLHSDAGTLDPFDEAVVAAQLCPAHRRASDKPSSLSARGSTAAVRWIGNERSLWWPKLACIKPSPAATPTLTGCLAGLLVSHRPGNWGMGGLPVCPPTVTSQGRQSSYISLANR